MKKYLVLMCCLVSMPPVNAAQDIIFNTKLKRGVTEVYADPGSQESEKYPSLNQLCYKNATAREALHEIMNLKSREILFHDWETEDFSESYIQADLIFITVYNEKKLDDDIDPDDAYETHEIKPCGF